MKTKTQDQTQAQADQDQTQDQAQAQAQADQATSALWGDLRSGLHARNGGPLPARRALAALIAFVRSSDESARQASWRYAGELLRGQKLAHCPPPPQFGSSDFVAWALVASNFATRPAIADAIAEGLSTFLPDDHWGVEQALEAAHSLCGFQYVPWFLVWETTGLGDYRASCPYITNEGHADTLNARFAHVHFHYRDMWVPRGALRAAILELAATVGDEESSLLYICEEEAYAHEHEEAWGSFESGLRRVDIDPDEVATIVRDDYEIVESWIRLNQRAIARIRAEMGNEVADHLDYHYG